MPILSRNLRISLVLTIVEDYMEFVFFIIIPLSIALSYSLSLTKRLGVIQSTQFLLYESISRIARIKREIWL